jgi:hypothetical protein
MKDISYKKSINDMDKNIYFIYKQNLYLKENIKELTSKINQLLIYNRNLNISNNALLEDINELINQYNNNNKINDNNLISTNNHANINSQILQNNIKDNMIHRLEKKLLVAEKRIFEQQILIDNYRQHLPEGFIDKRPYELFSYTKKIKRNKKK